MRRQLETVPLHTRPGPVRYLGDTSWRGYRMSRFERLVFVAFVTALLSIGLWAGWQLVVLYSAAYKSHAPMSSGSATHCLPIEPSERVTRAHADLAALCR